MGPELITVDDFLTVPGYTHFSQEEEVTHSLQGGRAQPGVGLLVQVRFQCKT